VRDILTEALGKVEFGERCKPSEALEKLQKEAWGRGGGSTFLLPGRGARALRDMKRLRPTVPVLVLSMHPEEHYALRRRCARGRAGYVNKEGGRPRILAGAVRKVLMGGTHVSARLARSVGQEPEPWLVTARP